MFCPRATSRHLFEVNGFGVGGGVDRFLEGTENEGEGLYCRVFVSKMGMSQKPRGGVDDGGVPFSFS